MPPAWRRLPMALLLPAVAGCGDATGPAGAALRLSGIVIATDGAVGTLDGTIDAGSGNRAAAAQLRMSTGATASLTGSWASNNGPCPSGNACVDIYVLSTLELRGNGWTFATDPSAVGQGPFAGPGRSGRFLFAATADSAGVVPLCGTLAGSVTTPDSTTSLEVPWFVLLGTASARFTSVPLDSTARLSTFDATVAGSTIRFAVDSTYSIDGTAAADRRRATGTFTVATVDVTAQADWEVTADGCVAPTTGYAVATAPSGTTQNGSVAIRSPVMAYARAREPPQAQR